MFNKISFVTFGCLLAVLILAVPAAAIEVMVNHVNQPSCDFLSVPELVDELGVQFPDDELIASDRVAETDSVACPSMDSPNVANVVVEIQNLTQRTFSEVWYVSDPETSLSNRDGLVNDQRAFRIDSTVSDPTGVNHPLILENGTNNDVFEPGEIWRFVIDDYFNGLGLPANALASQGLVGSLSVLDSMSSGSIIAVPEPGSCGMLILFALVVSRRIRR